MTIRQRTAVVDAADSAPAMPTGWYGVLFSADLAAGHAAALHAFGEDLVAFRGTDGVVGILDAYCAHMGAHLAHGGTVGANCVVCPFHRWSWGRDGTCVDIPYTDRIPARATMRSWPVRERNGMVFCWYQPHGEPPTWEVTTIPQTLAAGWSVRRRNQWGPFPSHPQELSENGVDFQHFEVIHGFSIRGIDWVPDGPRYRLSYDMEPLRAADGGAYSLDSLTEGPGFTRSIMSGSIEAASVHSWFPTDPGMVQVNSLYYFADGTPESVVESVYENSRAGWEKDVQIWSHKRFATRPLLVAGDGPVTRFRAWFDQFYT